MPCFAQDRALKVGRRAPMTVAPARPLLSTRAAHLALAALGGVFFVLLFLGAYDQRHHRITTFTVTALALALPYAGAAWVSWRARPARSTLVLGLAFAAAFRLFVLFNQASPYLSNDL